MTILPRRSGTLHGPKRWSWNSGLIDRMAHHGHDTKLAKAMLLTMQSTLDRMREHRGMIERAIAAGRK
jgi:hypothetical protein